MIRFTLKSGVVMREFRPDDAEAVYETVIGNQAHLQKFMHWMTPNYSIQSAKDFIAVNIKKREDRENLSLGLFRPDEKFIGSVGYVKFDWPARKTEIGYWIALEEQGKGIVTEACGQLIEFAFTELQLNRVEIRCSAHNIRSAAIPKRLGFTKEGHLRQVEMRNGRLHDLEIYGLLASDRRR